LSVSFSKEDSEFKKFLHKDDFVTSSYIMALFLKILEENSKSNKDYNSFKEYFKEISLLTTDTKKDFYYNRVMHFFKEDDFNLDFYKKHLIILKPLNDFICLNIPEFSRKWIFMSIKKNKFFKIDFDFIYDGIIKISSYDKDVLNILKNFFMRISSNISSSLNKIYYPEEEIFMDYPILFYNQDIFQLISNRRCASYLKIALDEFSLQKIPESIRSLGLALEELLTEIYCICFRKRVQNDSLTELLNNINSEFQKINFFKKNKEKDLQNNILQYLDKINSELQTINNSFKLKSSRYLFFPKDLYESIYIAINYRNKSSHRGSEELGIFEAALSFNGVAKLIIWWEYIHNSISDWDKSKKFILNTLIKESKSFMEDDKVIKRFNLFP